jgi:hypothetical protein
VFVAFDRNQQVISDAITGTTEVDTLMVNRLLNSERLFRRISKAVGFRQVIVSSISSLDLAEICFYDSVNQPGMRPIYAFYPSKAFRVYACQFMAGESLIEYEPAVSLPNDAVFHTTMDGATPRLSARPPKHLMSQRNSIGLPPPTARINNYSYGVRVRNMEEDLIMEIAKAESERVFLHDHDPTELRKQQKISESFTSDGFDESESRHRNLHLGKQATSTNVEHSRLLGMYASQYQQGVEELYRPYSPNTNSLYMGIMDQGGKSSPPTDTYTSSS